MLDWLKEIFHPELGAHREPVRQPPYFWERPDLIDPPLRPLPGSRQRRLTNADDTNSQLQSHLVAQLPTEIRVQIWRHVVGRENDEDVLHFELADGILRHNRCYQRESTSPGFQHNCWRAAWRKSFRPWALGGKQPVDHRRPVLFPLLSTCKLIYTEAIDLLYSTNTFDFRRTHAVIRLPHIILPHRMQQLRRVQFSTAFACFAPLELPPGLPPDFWKLPDDYRQWPAACEVLASLPRLQYVRITILLLCQFSRHSHPNEKNAALLCELLEPLKAVHASEFIVEISEHFGTVRERLGPTPFRLVEREKPVSIR